MKPMIASDFIKYVSTLPNKENLIESILPLNEVMLICGDPFKGKSLEAQRLACQFPIGGLYHGLKVKKCDSAYLTWEGSNKGLSARFSRFVKDIPKEKQPIVQKLDEPIHINTDRGYAEFHKLISQIKQVRDTKVIVVDSFSYTVEGDYKTDMVVNRWWESIQKLTRELDITFIFIWEFTKPLQYRSEDPETYDLSRLKTAYGTAYKVNTVVAMGEGSKVIKSNGKSQRVKTPQIVVMKAKDSGRLPPLEVTLNLDTLCYEGETWALDKITNEYIVTSDLT